MGLDVRALLLGAAAMTKRFLEEPFERNPVLQFAAVNYLMTEECHKPLRVLSVWSKKLEALGWWYDQLIGVESGQAGTRADAANDGWQRAICTRAASSTRTDRAIGSSTISSSRPPGRCRSSCRWPTTTRTS